MKKKEIRDLREKKTDYLRDLLGKKKLEIDQFVTKSKDVSRKNLKKGWNLRKEAAQILTLIREKEILEKEEKKV